MKISAAMAYYNGAQYIDEQLASILSQLGPEDEMVISVDAAEDDGGRKLEQWAAKDGRIRLFPGPGKGVVRNFENAFSHCEGDIIFVTDQDDVWKSNKVKAVMKGFERPEILAVLHNAEIVDGEGRNTGEKTLFALRGSRPGVWKNLIKNSYVGCCMAFRQELLSVLLPIPKKMYMHDYWIGTAAELLGKVGLIREPLIGYRRHGENVTEMTHGSVAFMIRKRCDILRCLLVLKKRIRDKKDVFRDGKARRIEEGGTRR